jgi:hypothetical protein
VYMPIIAAPYKFDSRNGLSRLICAGLATAITDGLFSSVLSVAVYGSTFSRLFQGVAATLVGNAAFTGGARTTALGLLMHCGVAFGWSAVFIFVVMRSARIRDVLASRYGALKVALVYGPFIWLVMSLLVIPVLLHRPPSISIRWWVQLFGHFPFVGIPIVGLASRGVTHSKSGTAQAQQDTASLTLPPA